MIELTRMLPDMKQALYGVLKMGRQVIVYRHAVKKYYKIYKVSKKDPDKLFITHVQKKKIENIVDFVGKPTTTSFLELHLEEGDKIFTPSLPAVTKSALNDKSKNMPVEESYDFSDTTIQFKKDGNIITKPII